ncbi:hypothetical protein, partial [Anoxybacillus flavithermus]|uniref:hypothetical protein n=1 Tax=Anoxybacillus flavithermus TaxID=33934 RepID=UPI001F5103A0
MIEKLVETVNGWLWSPFLIAFIVCCGLYFSIRTRFLQIRHVKEFESRLCGRFFSRPIFLVIYGFIKSLYVSAFTYSHPVGMCVFS